LAGFAGPTLVQSRLNSRGRAHARPYFSLFTAFSRANYRNSFPFFIKALEKALGENGIKYACMGSSGGIPTFKSDPSTEGFLLHAQAHASGLNLIEANHVFLCEPLLNTALELQAIARVDRIGQTHETTVWLYLMKGTVEESIYDLTASRR